MLVTFLIFAIVVVVLYYVAGEIPDATLQKVAKLIVVVGALLWLIAHIRSLLSAVGAT